MDEQIQAQIEDLAKAYRQAVESGESNMIQLSKQAIDELAQAQASLSKVAIITAFARSADA